MSFVSSGMFDMLSSCIRLFYNPDKTYIRTQTACRHLLAFFLGPLIHLICRTFGWDPIYRAIVTEVGISILDYGLFHHQVLGKFYIFQAVLTEFSTAWKI